MQSCPKWTASNAGSACVMRSNSAPDLRLMLQGQGHIPSLQSMPPGEPCSAAAGSFRQLSDALRWGGLASTMQPQLPASARVTCCMRCLRMIDE